MDNRIDLLLNASKEKVSTIPGLGSDKASRFNSKPVIGEDVVDNPFYSSSYSDTSDINLPLSQPQNVLSSKPKIINGFDRTPIPGLTPIDRTPTDLSDTAVEEGAKQYDSQNTNSILNFGKAIGSGILSTASSVAKAPEKTYKLLGGDYLEKGSAFEKQHPLYSKAVKSTMDWMSKGAEVIDNINKYGIGYDDYKTQQLQADVARSFDEGNYVSGLFTSMIDNPRGAMELAGNMYGFSKAMGAKGFTGIPAIVGSFTDNADQAKELFIKEHKRQPNNEELGAIMALSAVATSIDTAASKYLMGGAKGEKFATNLTKSVDNLVSKIPNDVARVALGGVGKFGAMMGTEGIQEGSQQALIDIAGTQDIDKVTSDKYLKDIYMNAAMGAIAGPGMHAVNVTGEVAPLAMTGLKDTYDKFQETINTPVTSSEISSTETITPVNITKPVEKDLTPNDQLKALDEIETSLKATGRFEEGKAELDAQRKQWTEIKNAVDNPEVYKALSTELKNSEDIGRQTYLTTILKSADRYLGKSKTLFDAVEGTTNEDTYVYADRVLRGMGPEWEAKVSNPLDIADAIQSVQTLRELRSNYGIKSTNSEKEDRIYNKAVDIVKQVLTQQLSKYPNYDQMTSDQKVGVIGDELYNWLKQSAPSEDINSYMSSMMYPVLDAMMESKTFGSAPKDEGLVYKGVKLDATVKEKSAPQPEAKTDWKEQQAKTKAKIETKLYADANLNVEDTTTDTHTGVSKGTINKLAETFKVPAAKVQSALDIAFQQMQIKKMGDISKESNAAQYEIYHGKDGILPNFVRFKYAAEKGDVETATRAIDNLVKRYSDQMYKLMIAMDSIAPVQEKIKALGKDVTLEQLKEVVGDTKITIQGAKGSGSEYTIDGMSIAKLTDSVPEDIRNEIKMGTGGHVLEAIKESVIHLQDMFDKEGLADTLPEVRFNKVLRDDIYNNLVDKIAVLMDKRDKLTKVNLDPTIKRTSEELDNMANTAKELAMVEKELATRIADQQKVFQARAGNLYQYNNTTFKEEKAPTDVSKKMGQEVGTITSEEAKRLGVDLESGTIKDYTPLKSADEYKKILDAINALKEEKSNVEVELNDIKSSVVEQYKNRKILLDKLKALTEGLNEESKQVINSARKNASRADKIVTDLTITLTKSKERKKELKSALAFLEKNEEVFKDVTVNTEQLVKLQSEYGKWMNGVVNKTGKVPTAKERNDKLRELVKGTTLLETIVNDLNKVSKIGVVLARKLMGVYTYDKSLIDNVREELKSVSDQIDNVQEQLTKAKEELKETIRQSRIQIVQTLRENGMTPDMSVKSIEQALMNSSRLKALRKRMDKAKKLTETKLKEIKKEIKTLEGTLKGNRLYKENIANNLNVVDTLRKAGIEIKAPLDMDTLKTYGSMLGNMNFSDIKTMIPEDQESISMLDMVEKETSIGMEKLYTGTVGTKLLGKLLAQNPALMLIARIDKVGDKEFYEFNYDKNMLNALMLTMENYIAINGSNLAINTKLDVSKMIGVSEYDPKVNQVYHQMMGIGKLHTTIASRIGDDFARAIGINQGTMGTEQYRKLIADLGNTALIMAKTNNLVVEPRMTAVQWNNIAGDNSKIPDDSEAQVKFVKLRPGKNTDVKTRAHRSTIFKRMNDTLNSLDEQSTFRTHKINAVSNKKQYEIDGSPFGIPEQSQEVMRHLEDQVYVVQENALKKLVNAYRDSNTRNLVMEKAGWKNLEDMDNELQDDKDAQESINREIEDTLTKLDEMEAAYTKGEITEDVYFNWFFTSNGRYMIDSIGINPQADKHFSRFMIVPEQNYNREWNIEDPVDEMLMYDGIAQAFGHDIDKSTEEATKDFARHIIKQFKTDDKFESKILEGIIEVPHFGHALQAIEFMRDMKDKKKFRSTLTAEYDAKTSGPMHKLMQAPILDDGEFGSITEEWLSKGAILVNKDFKESSSEHVSTLEDGYQTITKEADTQLGSHIPIRRSNDKIIIDYTVMFNKLNGLLDKLVSKNKVTKQGRNLGKSAFVPFGYAASTETIKRNIGETLAYDILRKVVDPTFESHDVIMNALGMSKREYQQLQSDLRSKPANEVRIKIPVGVLTFNKDILSILGEMFTMTYGEAYKSAMTSIFQPQVAMNTAIKDVTSAMFRMWKIKYDSMMEKEPNATVERKIEVIRSLEDYFPLIKAPWSKSKQDGIAIFDTKRTSMKTEELPTVNTTTNVEGQMSSETVQAMITEMEETFAAGAVLPIHWIDGTQIASVLMRGGITGVHDAIVIGMKGSHTQQTIKDMNKAMYDVNKNYNMFDEFQLALLNMLDKVDDVTLNTFIRQENAKNEKGIDLGSLKDRIDAIAENIRQARVKLYSNEITVGNIIAFRDTAFKGKEDTGNVNPNESIIKELLKRLEDKIQDIASDINQVSSKSVAEEGVSKLTKTNAQAEKLKEASAMNAKVGGSEEEQAALRKQVMSTSFESSEKKKYSSMTEEQIKEQEEAYKANKVATQGKAKLSDAIIEATICK